MKPTCKFKDCKYDSATNGYCLPHYNKTRRPKTLKSVRAIIDTPDDVLTSIASKPPTKEQILSDSQKSYTDIEMFCIAHNIIQGNVRVSADVIMKLYTDWGGELDIRGVGIYLRKMFKVSHSNGYPYYAVNPEPFTGLIEEGLALLKDDKIQPAIKR